MIQGLYSAATAMNCAAQVQDLLAENLAHANVPGYRRRAASIETFEGTLNQATTGQPNLRGSQLSASYDDFGPGPVESTGNPLDLAANGDTFFVLDGPTGPVYTRNGVFHLNAEGQLESSGGLRVRGEGGAIAIPPEADKITFTRDGVISANGEEVGRLQLVQIPSSAGMRRVGTTLFEGKSPSSQAEPGADLIAQGYREGSNVQVVQEMVLMMAGLRHYEASQRALRGLAEAVGLNTRPQAG